MISFFFFAFIQMPEEILENDINGTWVMKGGNYPKGYKYLKENSFNEKKPGIQFNSDHSVIRRRNSLNCGMKPYYYTNFNGNWKLNPDSTLSICYSFHKDSCEEDYKIVSISESKLVLIMTDMQIKFGE